jgi:LacI family transcriptional regulator
MQRSRVARWAGNERAGWLLAICWGAAAAGLATPAGAQERPDPFGQLSEKPLLTYRWAENPAKPYVEKLFSPSGVNVLRDSPADHKHHHGLMFAVAVDGVDFWSENPACGREHSVRPGPAAVQEIQWLAPSGEKLLRETRRVDARKVPQPAATLVTWRASLEPPAGKKSVTLSGSPYFGLGMRFVVSMDQGGHFLNADGKTGVAGTNAARSAWCAYSASADGKPVTVAMFDDPKNPRHPATWFTMEKPFAYVAATLDLSRQPFVIEAGKPLELRYAVGVWDGHADAAKIVSLYREAIALP